MRDPDDLLLSAQTVIGMVFQGVWKYRRVMRPLFSGGYDSLCACYCASQTPWFEGKVYHINTGIGAKKTREYVDLVCAEMGWELVVLKSPATYEQFVRKLGFPGPGAHTWIYQWIKDRCISLLVASKRTGGKKSALITGCRDAESTRRMGHLEPIHFGETSKKTGKVTHLNRIWVSPCYDWTNEEQKAFMDAYGFPRSEIKDRLGMSGECFCGAFAAPGEISRIEVHAPDVFVEIKRLTEIAKQCGQRSTWGG